MTQSSQVTVDTLPQVLHRARSLAEPLLRKSIGRLHPATAIMAGYHMGWCDADGEPLDGNGGKGVCLALAVLSAEAIGAAAEAALPGAVATELVHVASHMHDDIMDHDERRRDRTSLWKAFGPGPAILAGDAVYVLAVQVLLEAEAGRAAGVHLLDACTQLAHGQAEDLAFEKRPLTGPNAVDVIEYLAMAGGKTGALYAGALGIGAVLAGAVPQTSQALTAAGYHLGVLAQIVDDINGIWGDPAVTGKPIFSDIRSRKKSLPIVAALHAGQPASRRLADMLASSSTSDDHLAAVADLVAEAGGHIAATAQAQRQLELAIIALARVPIPADVLAEVEELGGFIRNRHA